MNGVIIIIIIIYLIVILIKYFNSQDSYHKPYRRPTPVKHVPVPPLHRRVENNNQAIDRLRYYDPNFDAFLG